MNASLFRCRAGGRFLRLWAAPPLFVLGGGSEQTGYSLVFMAGLVAACLAAGLFLGFLARRARRVKRVAGTLSDDILETLQRAMNRGVRMDMYPVQRAGNANALCLSGRCTGCSLTDLRLVFEMGRLPPLWPHTAVDIYFHEQDDDGQTTFYAFTSGIRQMRIQDGLLLLDMPLPHGLRREQRRTLFRLALPQAMSHALMLWPMNEVREDEETTDSRALGAPLFTLSSRHGLRQISMPEISAGGARLRLDAGRCRQIAFSPGPGDGLILLSMLSDRPGQDTAGLRRFWFKCLCRHTSVPHEDGGGAPGDSDDMAIGVQFRAWSVTDTLSEPVVWNEVQGNNGVPPLFEWLMEHWIQVTSGTEQ